MKAEEGGDDGPGSVDCAARAASVVCGGADADADTCPAATDVFVRGLIGILGGRGAELVGVPALDLAMATMLSVALLTALALSAVIPRRVTPIGDGAYSGWALLIDLFPPAVRPPSSPSLDEGGGRPFDSSSLLVMVST